MFLSVVLWAMTPGSLQDAEDEGCVFLKDSDTLTAWCHDSE